MLVKFDIKTVEAKMKIENLSNQIDNKLEKTVKSFKNLVTTLKKGEEKADQKGCVWLCEMRYLSIAASLADVQKEFGLCVKNVWEEAIYLENLRVSCVKAAMQEYIQVQSTVFTYQTGDTLEALSNIEENNVDCLSPYKLFRPDEVKVLEELGIIEDYMEKLALWTPENVTEFEWILKEGNVFMENGVFQQWQECYAIVVKSRFLHIFSSKPEFPFAGPLDSLYLADAKLMVSQSSEFYVEITENARSGFFNKLVTGKQIVIKTKDSENLTEWMELIQSLK